MPSQLHESHLLLFRNQPTLAADLIRDVLRVDMPPFSQARIVSADLTEVQPAEYRADLVIELSSGATVFGIVLEVQLAVDARKEFVWPAYVANLRARLECPVCLLVVTADEATARWAGRTIEMGGLHSFAPYVLKPSEVPLVLDEAQARANPELAVLSAMAHGRDEDSALAAQLAALAGNVAVSLDSDRAKLYVDLVIHSLSEAARDALKAMDIRKYEYQSDFARNYVAQGQQEGSVAVVIRLLSRKFGTLSDDIQQRIARSSMGEVETMADRLLTATTLSEVLGASIASG